VAEPGSPPAVAARERPAVANPLLAAFLAWIVPGAGHAMLKRTARGALFFSVVVATLWIGCSLQGNLYVPLAGQPLSYLATLGCMGLGLPYFLLRYLLGYHGDIVAAGYEYGTAFILTAGLMNLLLVLDAWDIATGKKD